MTINQNKGFTLVETLVALGILIIAVFGAFAAVRTGISTSIFSKDQVTAFYLAEEGVEQIRNIRDQNALATSTPTTWLTGISAQSSDPCYYGDGINPQKACTVDVKANALLTCPGAPGTNSCQYLKQDADGSYSYTSGQTTVFRREISLAKINDHEVSMLVTVSWSKGVITQTFKVRENLLDWE